MSGSAVNYIAGGTIGTSRFVMNSYAFPYQVLQANGTQPIVGISQTGQYGPPGLAGSVANQAAVSGQIIGVFQDEERDEPLLFISQTVTGGTLLCSDANGLGIEFNNASTTAQYVGAEARDSGVSGDLIRVRVRINTTGRMA